MSDNTTKYHHVVPPLNKTENQIHEQMLENCENLFNMETELDKVDPHDWWRLLISVFIQCVVIIFGLCGNVLLIYITRKFTSITYFYIRNMAIADICFVIGLPVRITAQIYEDFKFGHWACKFYFMSTYIHTITSPVFLVVIAVDRCLVFCCPGFTEKHRSPSTAKLVACIAWTIIAVHMTLTFIYTGPYTDRQCATYWPEWLGRTFDEIYSGIITFAGPLCSTLMLYTTVFCKLFLLTDINTSTVLSRTQVYEMESDGKLFQLVVGITVAYFVCWTPFWVTQSLWFFWPETVAVFNSFVLSICVSLLSSMMNPIICAVLSHKFKTELKMAVKCCIHDERHQPYSQHDEEQNLHINLNSVQDNTE